MCLDYHETSIHTSSIVCMDNFFLEDQDEWSFLQYFNIGFRIFNIEDALHYLCFGVESCVAMQQRKRIVCCGIYVAPKDGGIIPVNGRVSAMDVNDKGSD